MKHNLLLALALSALASSSMPAGAAETLSLTWTNPTTSIDGVPLTGANALTGIDVHCATAPIADVAPNASAGTPTATLPVVTGASVSMTVNRGDTVYCRLRSVRGAEKSAFSNQASKLIPLSTTPNAPTQLLIDLIVNPPPAAASAPAQ